MRRKHRFAGVSPSLCLPKDRPPPAGSPTEPAYLACGLSGDVLSDLDAEAEAAGCTQAEFLLAAFATLLFRHSQHEDVFVAWCRLGPGSGSLEVLPVRVTVSEDDRFADVLAKVQEAQRVGRERGVVRNLSAVLPDASPTTHGEGTGSGPGYDRAVAAFWDDGEDSHESAAPGLGPDSGVDEALGLRISRTGDGFRLRFVYDSRRFSTEFMSCVAEHYRGLLESAVADVGQTVGALDMVTAPEREKLLGWSVGESDQQELHLRHARFEQHARTAPEKPAVVHDGGTLTYGELNRRANQLAHLLRGLGVGPESAVAVCLSRSTHTAVAYMGILKAGGAIFPLAPSAPESLRRAQLRLVSPSVIVTTSEDSRFLDDGQEWPVLRLDDAAAELDAQPATDPDVTVTAEDPVFLLATSGSTGDPKIVETLAGYRRPSPAGAEDERHLLKSSSGTTFTVSEVLRPLMSGGTLFVAPEEVESDPWRFVELIGRHRLSHLLMTPSQLRVLLEVEDLAPCSCLRQVHCSGEKLSSDLRDRFFDRLDADLVISYGCTEAPTATARRCSPEDGPDRVDVGRTTPGMEAYVLDDHRRLAPIGMPGDVFLGGLLARGYRNDPVATAERFLPHPFNPDPDARVFLTGDVGRWLPTGNLEILGRRDGQVKIRGNRVELGEVEARLARHDAVADCAAALRTDVNGDSRIVAYWTPRSGARIPISELRRYLLDALPEHAVPSAFVRLESLPLTPSGKINRRALPDPDTARPDLETTYLAPRDDVEEALAAIWSEVLGVDEVGTRDDFLELGGDSLSAALTVSRVIAEFGVELPVQEVLRERTIEGVAPSIRAALEDRATDSPTEARGTTIPRRESRDPCRASYTQEAFWFLHEHESESAVYNMPTLLGLTGDLDVGALERTLSGLVERHEALATVFSVEGGALMQQVLDRWELPLPLVELRGVPPDEQARLMGERIAQEVRRRFDLASDLMIRATLFRLAEREHRLLLVTHHIATDHWSTNILLNELTLLYEALASAEPSPLPELPIQYADYAVWERARLEKGALEEHLSYWKEELAGSLPVMRLPTDRPRPAIRTHNGARHPVRLSPESTRALQELARSRGTTLFGVLMAVLQTLLHRYSGEDEILVGFPIASRRRIESERLVGNLINTLALRTDFSGDPSFDRILRSVHEKTLSAHMHQDLPFTKLVEALRPERDPARSTLFEIMLDFGNLPRGDVRFSSLGAERFRLDSNSSVVDLTLYLRDSGGELTGALEYNTDLFDPSTIARMGQHFTNLVKAVTSNPNEHVSALRLLTESEERQLLHGFSGPKREWAFRGVVHELFEAQAEQTPEAVAVSSHDGILTYDELGLRANEFACHLADVGAAPGDLVGICMDRSAEMVVALLGILKAGAGYVPLDPTFPEERISFMARDAGLRVVVSGPTYAGWFQAEDDGLVVVDPTRVGIGVGGRYRPVPNQGDETTAYVVYTSGSTGTPKGVRVSHRCLVNFLLSMRERPGLTSDDVVLAVTTLSFDISTLEIFLPLIAGARITVADSPTVEDGRLLSAAIEESGATIMQATPATWRMLVDAGWAGAPGMAALCGGEALPPELAHRLASMVAHVWNMYGPTETTVWSTCGEVQIGGPRERISIGRPIANTQVYVLDPWLRPVPIGVQGELYIGGEGVTDGYLNRPELTEEWFLPDPFAELPSARLYRTGDLGRWRDDGQLELHGRADRQTKVRGHRIEPGEIENALSLHPAVETCVVDARTLGPGDVRLVVYAVYGNDEALTASDVRRFLRRTLPRYMVPGLVVELDSIPLTPNGKLDRSALPDPFAAVRESKAFAPPSGPLEEMLADVWHEVLGVDRVGREDNFFELGGHSLLSIRVVYAVEERTGHKLDPRRLFFQTLAQVAASIPDGEDDSDPGA